VIAPARNGGVMERLRTRHPSFWFREYDWRWRDARTLTMRFRYEMAGGVIFQPPAEMTFASGLTPVPLPNATIDRLVFHFGLALLVSYWKCACPPRIVIEAGALNVRQVAWWKRLYFHGLGEFFFLNGIAAELDSFVEIEAPMAPAHGPEAVDVRPGSTLIPVGGGKDSAVTLELLRDRLGNAYFAINPIPAALNCLRLADPELSRLVTLTYRMEPKLLELNDAGYLNGHTPFSALVAVGATLAAAAIGAEHIALSNEASANEGNATIGGVTVNHQYSKSLAFERDFRDYNERWLAPGLNYFSLLRPLSEIQVARAFADCSHYHPVFNSCNRGGRRDQWCGRCAKCLFTYVMLAPYLGIERLRLVFGEDLLNRIELREPLRALLNLDGAVKPFDCVGTPAEVRLACGLLMRNQRGEQVPRLLREIGGEIDWEHLDEAPLNGFAEHCLSPEFAALARCAAEAKVRSRCR